ncbi:MAG: hypothetical protein CVU57_24275 [Deltaproteobacteria bacterium HGW-Deltaproteobacteria-15]|jgi:hypothetical protein|nr:MAG: hypothetical protein CVU57_24275 [Deltaproteobacteria bacterium HGW-Deltaproteobacteria-15]
MTLKKRLSALVSAIMEEAQKNESFRANVERALGINASPGGPQPQAGTEGAMGQRKGRRTPAVLDPVELARQGGEIALRDKISTLTLDQLRDIVAQYGMDPGKLVMKWKDVNRVIERIVELALARSTKGDAFRND